MTDKTNQSNIQNRTIFINDNLEILGGMNDNSVNLIYLDPPFNSNRNYEAPTGSKAAGAAFKDAWYLDDIKSEWVEEVESYDKGLHHTLMAAGEIHSDGMMAYLTYMTVRLIEMKRVLAENGSIYLHVDDTASHYLKVIMDSIFGSDNFRNEITWQRAITAKGNLTKGLARDADTILRYSKSNSFIWNVDAITQAYDMNNLDEKTKKQYSNRDESGRLWRYTEITAPTQTTESNTYYEVMGVWRNWRWTKERMQKEIESGNIIQTKPGNVPRFKRYLDEQKGKQVNNIWTDISNLTATNKERTGYPTQKPLALLERIIRASSNEGDIVFDPFCGCATTLVAAEKLGRKWIGCDISPKAYELVKDRLFDLMGEELNISGRESVKRTDLDGKGTRSKNIKSILFSRQKGCCRGCERERSQLDLEIDHIKPRSKGGLDVDSNLQLLCSWCNRTKGNREMSYLMSKIEEMRNDGFLP